MVMIWNEFTLSLVCVCVCVLACMRACVRACVHDHLMAYE